jgi:polyisoprenoid-binding protein YceI
MKFVIFLFSVVALGFHTKDPITYRMDTSRSTVRWEGYYLFDFGSHNGTINLLNGELKTADGQLSEGNFAVDMKSIKDVDMPENDGGKDLSHHLRSEDFFDSEKFPQAYFVITKVETITGAQSGKPNADIYGKMTLKGISQPLKFPALVEIDNQKIHAHAHFKFDRTKWDVRYNSGKFFNEVGDGAISDAIGIEIDILAIRD